MIFPGSETSHSMSRRDVLKGTGAALGGLAVLGPAAARGAPAEAGGKGALQCDADCYPSKLNPQGYDYFDRLPPLRYWQADATGFKSAVYPPLGEHEMRITFMGSNIPPVRRAQQLMSIFVEVGWDPKTMRALDSFVFDCGSGVTANYGAMDVGYGRMDKVFVTHLHADHMSDLSTIYCFGVSGDRWSPLYVFGPGPSGVKSPRPPGREYDDGTKAFCRNLRDAMRWHTESFSFLTTSYRTYPSQETIKAAWGLPVVPEPVSDDPWGDGYCMVPIELDWTREGGVAYDNPATGVRVTHFPVVHTRRGSIGYKLEWRGLSMIYTSDTRPENVSIRQAINGGKGVDVFIHEAVVPPDVWAMNMQHLPKPPAPGANWAYDLTRAGTQMVQDSSHTPQGAYGYLLGQIRPKRPRLSVVTHFPVSNDTVDCAMRSIRKYVPDVGELGREVTFSFDRMVLSAFDDSDRILQRRAEVLDFGVSPIPQLDPRLAGLPKYHDARTMQGDPLAQIDTREVILPGPETYCDNGY